MAGGRPSKYKPEYCIDIIKFFSVEKNHRWIKKERTTIKSNGTEETEKEYGYMANDLPTFDKFARSIEVNGDTIVAWTKKYPEFSAAYNTAKELQKEFLIDNGLKGLYPPATMIFVAKNITDMKDKTETELTGKNGKEFRIIVKK